MEFSLITATHKRPEKLKNICLPSVLSQSYLDFEWIVVNDGEDSVTRDLIGLVRSSISIKYEETKHLGLCAARNLGLDAATGELVGFLDDDNAIYEKYVEEILKHFEINPNISMAMPIQNRRRDSYRHGQLIKRGRDFIGPKPHATNEDFVMGKGMFDSNGFVHRKNPKIRFNKALLILSDYEYLLRCFSEFGLGSFLLCQQHLVRYIQTNNGIIGQSSWEDWLREQEYIWQHRSKYSIFNVLDPAKWMPKAIEETRKKVKAGEDLPGFVY